jgi:hypothetical protein
MRLDGFDKDNEAYDCQKCRTNNFNGRNCRKYNNPRSDYRWDATYLTSEGTPYTVDDTEIDECPVSLITPASVELVQVIDRMHIAKDRTGASPYGTDLSKYPSKLVDSLIAIEIEERKVALARHTAERAERD